MTPDLLNACFEFLGSLFVLASVRKVKRDRMVAGVSWLHVAFFTAWGYWNCLYYPMVVQPLSFLAGVCLAFANTWWVSLLVRYSRNPESDLSLKEAP